MNDRDTALTVAVIGILVFWVARSGAALNYVRPSMVPWLERAGLAIALAAVFALIASLRRRGAHDHRNRVAALLFVPIVVAVVIAPSALGSWALGERQGVQWSRSSSFDLAKFLHTQAVANTTPRMQVREFVIASQTRADRALLSGMNAELVGFVSHPGDARDRVMLTRFVVTCCAADAAPASVELTDAPSGLRDNEWIDAVVRFAPEHTAASAEVPVARVVSARPVPKPALPYESAYG